MISRSWRSSSTTIILGSVTRRRSLRVVSRGPPHADCGPEVLAWTASPDASAVRLDQLPADGQPEAETLDLLGSGIACAAEHLEDARLLSRGQPDTVVLHTQEHTVRF